MQNKDSRKQILIVGGIPVVCAGLEKIIDDQPGLELMAAIGQISEVPRFLRHQRPNLIVKLLVPQMDAVEMLKNLLIETSDIPILVLSMHDEMIYARRVLQAGAMGYIMATASCGEIVQAIFSVLRGNVVASPAVVKQLLAQGSRHSQPPEHDCTVGCLDALTDRELAVFKLIGTGKTTREISDCLHLSPKTVQTHREKIKDKLRLKNSARLAYAAATWIR